MSCAMISITTFVVIIVLTWAGREVLRSYRLDVYRDGFLAGTKATMKAKVVKNPNGQDVYYVDGMFRDPYEDDS